MKERFFTGALTPEENDRERKHRVQARSIAAEGMVLLRNEGVLPLKHKAKVALYGDGARHTVKGGTGSGSVNSRATVSIDEGLRRAGITITTDDWLDDYDRKYEAEKIRWRESLYEKAGTKPGDGTAEEAMRLYAVHASNPMAYIVGKEVCESPVSEEDREEITAILVISRISGEGADRRAAKGDYYISDEEEKLLSDICRVYKKVVVVLNVGGIMDLSCMDQYSVSGLVLMSLAGMEGGNALADLLTGKKNFSGKLTDTWAYAYGDYPSSEHFSHNDGNVIREYYKEGIYVGYRYFDTFGVKVRYPFGFGLSYTTFETEVVEVCSNEEGVTVSVKVKNTGAYEGKEVLQTYVSCPNGLRKCEAKRLVAFAKTKVLQPGEDTIVAMKFSAEQLMSWHTGKACYYLNAGAYYVLVGTDCERVKVAAELCLAKTEFGRRHSNICPLTDALREIEPESDAYRTQLSAEAFLRDVPKLTLYTENAEEFNGREERQQAAEQNVQEQNLQEQANAILAKLSIREKTALVCGQPKDGDAEFIGNAANLVPGAAGETTNILNEHGIKPVVMADGPAGIRILQCYEENPEDHSVYTLNFYRMLENRFFGDTFPNEGSVKHYQFCTAIPVGTLLAQAFDPEVMEMAGELVAKEMREFHISLWLAPGMNIHRNPLCGRNFEYYSEDPLLSGKMAAALTRSIQKENNGMHDLGTTIKHYACNNQEENRRGVSSVVSERALREIYLKGFEIAVRESQPLAIMTSYNKVNSIHTANSYDLCTVAARNEWGFKGIIMTDWTTTNSDGGSSAARCIAAGNDLIMPGTKSDMIEIMDAIEEKGNLSLSQEDLDACALRMLVTILRTQYGDK